MDDDRDNATDPTTTPDPHALAAAARESQARYRGLFDSIDQGFCVVQVLFDAGGRPVDYRFLEANPAFERQTGLTGAVGRTARELVPALEGHWFEIYGRVAATGEPVRFQEPSDPMGRWFDVYAFRTGDPAEHKVAILFRDVTDAKRSEAALRESERRFRDMADTAPAILWVTEADGRCSFLSRGWYELTGQTQAQALGYGWVDAAHPDDRAAAGDAFVAASAARRAYAVDFRVRRADGAYRWVIDAGRPRFGPGGEFLGMIGSVIDIHDRKRAEDELRAGEARLQLAVAIAQMGTFEIDLATDAVTVNDAGRAIYGWPPGEPLTFANVQSHFHPDDRDEVLRRVGEALRPDGPGEFEVEQRIVRTDGQTRWIRVRGRALFEDAGGEGGGRRAARCVGTYLDVTAVKEAEQRREQLLDAERAARLEADRAGRMKDEFLATLSHELRTPLNAILGWAQILRGGGATPDDVAEGVEIIERNARAQTRIIEDLLDMSRIVSGKIRLDVLRLDLAGVVAAAAETVKPAADAKGVRVQTLLDPLAGPVSGDPNRLQQVFWNLLTNAVKFTPRGGRVQVLLERVNSHVEVSVLDTGEGIAPAFLPHVFDRFRQADATTTRRHGGLGLGLAIVKQLVELHGGSVRVKSGGPGRGATFTVALPLTPIHPDTVPDAGRRHSAGGGTAPPAPDDACIRVDGVRVLVVDDEPDARTMVRRLLEDCGASVTTASTAQEALDAVRTHRPDVLVSDIGMPGEDGYALIRRVRSLGPGNGGETPAVALTAYARSEDRTRSVLAGYQMHVPKPVEASELIAIVASLAGRTGNRP
jgi:PAS domain S-box-containing protein